MVKCLWSTVHFISKVGIHIHRCELLTVSSENVIYTQVIFCCLCLFVLGDFNVINFRDITAENDLDNNTAIFEFEFDPVTRLNTSLGYDLHLTWSQVSGPSSGVIEAASCRYYKRSNAQLERVGRTGTYRLYVPLHLLGEGRLLVIFTINIYCINDRYRYRYRCNGCYDWQVRGISDSLEISSKRG